MKSNGQSGQASVEYLIVAGALVAALFYPISHHGSVMVILVQTLMDYFKAQAFVVSIL